MKEPSRDTDGLAYLNKPFEIAISTQQYIQSVYFAQASIARTFEVMTSVLSEFFYSVGYGNLFITNFNHFGSDATTGYAISKSRQKNNHSINRINTRPAINIGTRRPLPLLKDNIRIEIKKIENVNYSNYAENQGNYGNEFTEVTPVVSDSKDRPLVSILGPSIQLMASAIADYESQTAILVKNIQQLEITHSTEDSNANQTNDAMPNEVKDNTLKAKIEPGYERSLAKSKSNFDKPQNMQTIEKSKDDQTQSNRLFHLNKKTENILGLAAVLPQIFLSKPVQSEQISNSTLTSLSDKEPELEKFVDDNTINSTVKALNAKRVLSQETSNSPKTPLFNEDQSIPENIVHDSTTNSVVESPIIKNQSVVTEKTITVPMQVKEKQSVTSNHLIPNKNKTEATLAKVIIANQNYIAHLLKKSIPIRNNAEFTNTTIFRTLDGVGKIPRYTIQKTFTSETQNNSNNLPEQKSSIERLKTAKSKKLPLVSNQERGNIDILHEQLAGFDVDISSYTVLGNVVGQYSKVINSVFKTNPPHLLPVLTGSKTDTDGNRNIVQTNNGEDDFTSRNAYTETETAKKTPVKNINQSVIDEFAGIGLTIVTQLQQAIGASKKQNAHTAEAYEQMLVNQLSASNYTPEKDVQEQTQLANIDSEFSDCPDLSIPPIVNEKTLVPTTLNISLSTDAPDEDIRELERKIGKILSEQLSRYYGSPNV